MSYTHEPSSANTSPRKVPRSTCSVYVNIQIAAMPIVSCTGYGHGAAYVDEVGAVE